MKSNLLDLSHEIGDGVVTYKGLPAPIVCDFLSRASSRDFYEPGTEFQIAKIEMVANTGTYIDVPFHRYENGKDLSQISLERFADLDAICISIPFSDSGKITEYDLMKHEVKGKAVLIHTGWDQFWQTENYFENHPFLTAAAATFLKDAGAKLVGIDSHNIDDTTGRSRPAHSQLLRDEILIVEHLCNLNQLVGQSFQFSAVPPKFKGVGTFPVRAFAKLQ